MNVSPEIRIVVFLLLASCVVRGENRSLLRDAGFEDAKTSAWKKWTPRSELAPEFSVEPHAGRAGSAAATIRCQSAEQLGAWTQRCAGVTGGSLYRFSGYYRVSGGASANESVTVKLEWLDATGKALAKDFVSRFQPEGEWLRVEDDVPAPAHATGVVVGLGLQWCLGTVWWDDLSLVPVEGHASRKVRISTLCFVPPSPSTPQKNMIFYGEKIDQAGREHPDVVCLGETINYVSAGDNPSAVAEPIPGPSTKALGEAAERNRLWVVTSLYERDGNRVYNTAVLIDRQGKLVGRYRKTHLPEAEVIKGVAPGSDYPVFKTDFGIVGMQVCYDNFFPEVARSLALNGAEIIFTPIWGDPRGDGYEWDIVARARAIDNAVHFVASMYGPNKRSLIIDPGGHILADTKDHEGIVTAEIDLDRRRPERWLSVGSVGEWKRMYPKERRPGTYRELTRDLPEARK